ncbi:hypothetical protein [Rhizohabitans arisaemae]|uniref:hypothetical protein n=1 Tax=Rhizohabitans arisaemae TaxID=2720610 RepID=UPI0024B12EFB|nr:hypothetical protein [Rhizohabitans arisaemae]
MTSSPTTVAPPVTDDLGSRDLARLCDRIIARLLIMHSGGDEVIPVNLRECLPRAGRHEPQDFVYLEPRTGGHGEQGPEPTRRLLRP